MALELGKFSETKRTLFETKMLFPVYQLSSVKLFIRNSFMQFTISVDMPNELERFS